ALTTEAAPAVACILAPEDERADRAVADRPEIEATLTAAEAALRAYRRAMAELLEAASLPPAAPPVEAAHMTPLVALSRADPAPDPAWLDPDAFARTAALLEAATGKAGDLAAKAELLESFEPELFELAPEFASRFAEDYGNPLRYLRPGYWRDMGRL